MDEYHRATGSAVGSAANNSSEDPCKSVTVDKMLDEGEVDAAKRRLMAAVDSEHLHELNSHAEKLASSRDSLVERGVLLTGMYMERIPSMPNLYRVFKPNNQRLPRNHKFSFKGDAATKKRITMLADFSKLEEVLAPQVEENKRLVEDIGEEGNLQFKCDSTDMEPTPFASRTGSSSSGSFKPCEEDIPETQRNPNFRRGACPTVEPASEEIKAAKAVLESCLKELGLHKCFDGTVLEVHDTYIIISSKYANAPELIKDNGARACWAMFDCLCDVTFRQRRCAVSNLGTLMGTNTTTASGDNTPNEDEVRVRKILLAAPTSKLSSLPPASMASARVQWMTVSALEELDAVLCQSGLNDEQKRILHDAFRRSVNLLQGPPGTGKSVTLAAAAKALCQVFHGPEGSSKGLPNAELQDWSVMQVRYWLQNLATVEVIQQEVEGAQQAAEGIVGRFLPRAVKGVTNEIKEWLLAGTVLGCSGKRLAQMKHDVYGLSAITEGLVSEQGGSMADDEADEIAKKCLPVLLGLRDELKESMLRNQSAVHATRNRQMRIVLCAETNVAVDNILGYLHKDADFMARNYNIIRVGLKTDESLSEYMLGSQLQAHPLMLLYTEYEEATKEGNLASVVKRQLKRLQKFCEVKRDEAKMGLLNLALEKRVRLIVEMLEGELMTKLRRLLQDIEEEEDTEQKAYNERISMRLSRELKDIASFDVLVRAQVILGTNTSIGQLRFGDERLRLSNPIVLMDEAGQSTEPSSLIPLTLGAEWVLMAADLKQLRPTIITKTAAQLLGYWSRDGGSLYGRLHNSVGLPQVMLEVQYRMNPLIRLFPSDAFYRGCLKEDPRCPPDMRIPVPRSKDGTTQKWWSFQQKGAGLKQVPVAFLNACTEVHAGLEGCPDLSKSYSNPKEACLAMGLMRLFGTDQTLESIAILSPYRAQCQLVCKLLEQSKDKLQDMKAMGHFHPKVYGAFTIDSFQGQEADVVIVTTVMSNRAGRPLGHLADCRRLNVAITRARRALLVLGDESTLCSVVKGAIDKGVGDCKNYWPNWINWVKENGGFGNIRAEEVDKYFRIQALLPPPYWVMASDQAETKPTETWDNGLKIRHMKKSARG